MVSRERLFQLATLVVIGAALLALTTATPEYPEARLVGRGVQDFAELSERFVALSENKGAVYAFEVLRRAKLPLNTDLHLLGHAVGDELYKQKGLGGITYCTQDFRNACSHAIVIGALNEFGPDDPSIVGILRNACMRAPGGVGAYTMCFHGLGHGVFAYFGYSLLETVDFCKKTGTRERNEREYIECIGGAVMELMGGGGHDREKWLAAREQYLPADKPLAPCMSGVIPDEAKEICLTYITPRLWELSGIDLGTPDAMLFPAAFDFCDVIPREQTSLREACFGGFGKDFVAIAGHRDIRHVDRFTDEEYVRAIEWCALARSPEGREACVAEAVASVFWGGENDPEASFRFCALVSDKLSRSACYERLSAAIGSYIHDEGTRNALCERLPEEYQGACASKDA
ncbi:hypothetical protein A3A39_02305 [Candidatus Kaiserbacteria bacterium RIFCSPLOWO2_01_FULL_54_13]|uniref:Uncharacterized protein n=1 Tax=Candidatus Kaiserbacteria bacterium RIFCSPLOWO2_01_FULL_54_13 TaxID=1798512 RepID=A0A1F6F188_9BACT|nr:MAG: hypothetical protein A3A39_02305 [Candidatus Kaiserbacteria bacterium RIFCSPLOWO2_01_FULL_54_13]